MSELFSLLCDSVYARSRAVDVALLLSGGLDSTSVGIALTASGKRVRTYTYEVDGYASADRSKAEMIARHFGWPLRVVTIPSGTVRADFIRLAVDHRARKKVHFEVTYPLLYLMPQIEEDEIWAGWNADDHYGNTRKVILEQAALIREGINSLERKQIFDAHRERRFVQGIANPASDDTYWFAKRLAASLNKALEDPYSEPAVAAYFRQFDHQALSSPQKPLVRRELALFLRGLPPNAIAAGVRLQKGGQVDKLFETLLDDQIINRFQPAYTSVSGLCQRWAREVKANARF